MSHISSSEKEELSTLTFGIAITKYIFAVLGVIGNILVLRVLLQRNMQNTFNKLRCALAAFDILHCMTWLLQPMLKNSSDAYVIATPYILWPLMNFSYTASMFMTMAIAVERFVAINDPYNYRMNRRYRAIKYVSLVTIPAILLNITKFFEFEKKTNSESPGVLANDDIKLTETYHDQRYAIYNTSIYTMLIRGIIPITVLICIYTKIYMKLKKSHLEPNTSKIKCTDNEANEHKRTREEKRAYTFVGVVVTSLICAIPEMFVQIAFLALGLPRNEIPPWLLILGLASQFFLIINSVANIVIYTSLDKKFRQELRNIFQKIIRFCKPQENYAPSNNISMTLMEIKTKDTQPLGSEVGFMEREQGVTGEMAPEDRKDKRKREEESEGD